MSKISSPALLAVFFLAAGPAGAAVNVTVDSGTVWQTAKPGDTTEGFVEIHNSGNMPDVLTQWDCTLAAATSLNGADGKPVQSLTIPAGQTVTLAPNGLHLVLQGARDTVNSGSVVPCSFTFQNTGDVAVYLNAVTTPGQ